MPPTFQAIYTSLDTYLTNFNATLGPPTGKQVQFTGNLVNANANAGPQLGNSAGSPAVWLQLQELKSMGVRAIMVEVGFPMLYEPFLTSQGQSYSQYVTFYQQVAANVRAAGLKLIVENDTLLSSDVQAGWNTAPFYATLNWTEYQEARAQTASTIAQTMQPDYLVVLEEPDTEANNTGQTNVNTPSGATAMLSGILTSVHQSGVPNMQVGAGVGTWLKGYLGFIQDFVALSVDFIDMHIYPINDSMLPNALQIAATAAAAGKPVAMTECWVWKISDSELNVLTPDQVRARDPFSFWAPLDAYFIQTMQNLANSTGMLFVNPFGSQYFAAYLPYDSSTENLTPSQILSQENSQAAQNMGQAMYTSTATSYYASLVSPPDKTPPSVPTGLTGASANPNTAILNWNASTDNVGVAGYYVLRNGSVVATTANIYYQDSGLTESTTYAYSIESFDLAGNISAPSLRVNVTTRDVTPPSTPGNVAAVAVSCERVTVTWSPSTDNVGIGSYIVYWGLSPASLVQAGRALGTSTSYTSYPLTAGTTYYYGVEAVDKSGNDSAMSTVVSATTPMPPAAPANVSVLPVSATKMGLTWSASASGGLPIQNYDVYRGTTTSNLSQVAIVLQTSYTDQSLNPATKYYYAVEAADSGGDISNMSTIVPATTFAPPSAPAGLVATPVSTSIVGLTWSASASGGLPIQNYHVYRGTTSSSLSQVAIVLQTSYTDQSLNPAMKYYYAVEAADTAGDLSQMSTTVAVTTPTAPSAPTGLVATPLSTTKVGLTWSVAGSGGLPIRDYLVFRGVARSSLTQVATVLQPAYTDVSVSPATTYYYAVQAADTGGDLSPMSATVSATTLALPSAPTKLVATAPSKSQVSLTWTAAKSGMPLASYSIYRGSSPSGLAVLQKISATKTAFTDNTVAAGTTYYYAVQAEDTGGNLSPLSAVAAVTTPK